MKKSRLAALILPAAALILEMLPNGAVLNFANPEGLPWRQTYSYFSVIPFGYANFGPLLTAMLTCVAAIILVIYSVSGKKGILRAGKYLCGTAAVASLTPLLFGLSSYSLVGGLISAVLVGQTVLLQLWEKK